MPRGHLSLAIPLDILADLSVLPQQQNDQVLSTLLMILVPVIVAFSFFVFVFYRSRRESFVKQREVDFKLRIAESELKALRVQMNPHFIFNSLNSIHHFMHSNHAQAGEYLVKFSQLIRHMLESSSLRMVPMVDEIDANRNYMQLEQLRLNHSFEFTIRVGDDVNIESTLIPPMLIQPFIENSIWHGLNQQEENGQINIIFSEKDDLHIQCVIEDNGIENDRKFEGDLSPKVKKTSMALTIIRERLEIVNTLYGTHARFEITDRPDGKNGKRVSIEIPFED